MNDITVEYNNTQFIIKSYSKNDTASLYVDGNEFLVDFKLKMVNKRVLAGYQEVHCFIKPSEIEPLIQEAIVSQSQL